MNPDGLQWEEAGSQLPIDWSIAQLRERGFACTYYFEGEPRSRIMTVARGLSGAALIAAAVLATTASTAPPNLATTLGRCLVLLCGVLLLASALHGSLAFVRRREFRRSRNKAAELRAASPTAKSKRRISSISR